MIKEETKVNSWDRVLSKSWTINGINLGHGITRYGDIASTQQVHVDREAVRLHFGLRGDYQFRYKQLGRNFDLAGGHHNIMYSKVMDLEIQNKTPEIESFGIEFPKQLFLDFTQDGNDLLKVFAEEILIGKSAIIAEQWGSVNSPIQLVIDEITMNQYSGSLQNIFLLAKTLELLVLCVENYTKKKEQPVGYLKTNLDKEKIIAARDYINGRITSPPSLSEISKAIGLNEFKLKNGFKEMFDSTVFNYLTKRRLNISKQYLLDTTKSLTEISVELGYSSPQHFSNQFKQYFGVSPNSMRKSI